MHLRIKHVHDVNPCKLEYRNLVHTRVLFVGSSIVSYIPRENFNLYIVQFIYILLLDVQYMIFIFLPHVC